LVGELSEAAVGLAALTVAGTRGARVSRKDEQTGGAEALGVITPGRDLETGKVVPTAEVEAVAVIGHILAGNQHPGDGIRQLEGLLLPQEGGRQIQPGGLGVAKGDLAVEAGRALRSRTRPVG